MSTKTAGGGQNKGKRYHPEPLTRDEVIRLLASFSRRSATGLRNRALVTVLYRAGLRCNEARWLYPKDVDPEAGSIRVLFGKGSKGSGRRQRTVALDPMAFAVLELWLERRAQLAIDPGTFLFCTLTGAQLDDRYVRAMLERHGRKAGIQRRVHPHGLRHTCAAELAEEGIPVNQIQAQLGHSNLGTTSTYLDHIRPEKLLEMGRARRWNPEGREKP